MYKSMWNPVITGSESGKQHSYFHLTVHDLLHLSNAFIFPFLFILLAY